VDLVGLATITPGLLALVLAVDQSDVWGWTSPAILALLGGAAALLALFAIVEARVPNPLVDLRLFRAPAFLGANLVGAIQNYAFCGAVFFLTLYFQTLRGYSPVDAGLMLVPMSVAFVLTGVVGGRLVHRFGARALLAVGMTLLAAVQLAISGFSLTTGWLLILLPLTLHGVADGLAYTFSTTAGMKAAPESEAGEASGIVNMTKVVGGVFGIAITQAVFQQIQASRVAALAAAGPARADAQREAFVAAFGGSMLVIATLSAVGVVLTLLLIRERPAPSTA
jgi:predicted MFS family arabinose efflux permease